MQTAARTGSSEQHCDLEITDMLMLTLVLNLFLLQGSTQKLCHPQLNKNTEIYTSRPAVQNTLSLLHAVLYFGLSTSPVCSFKILGRVSTVAAFYLKILHEKSYLKVQLCMHNCCWIVEYRRIMHVNFSANTLLETWKSGLNFILVAYYSAFC